MIETFRHKLSLFFAYVISPVTIITHALTLKYLLPWYRIITFSNPYQGSYIITLSESFKAMYPQNKCYCIASVSCFNKHSMSPTVYGAPSYFRYPILTKPLLIYQFLSLILSSIIPSTIFFFPDSSAFFLQKTAVPYHIHG